MWSIKLCACLMFTAALSVDGQAQEQKMCSSHATMGGERSQPLIFGKPYTVPELKLRFEDATTGKPLSPSFVNIHYYSQWIMYPAPEHSWGVWAALDDWVRCSPGGQTEITIPAFTVKPRGWYDGKYVKFPYTLSGSKQPRFDRLEIVMEFDSFAPRLKVKESDLKRFNGAIAIVKLPFTRSGLTTVEFTK